MQKAAAPQLDTQRFPMRVRRIRLESIEPNGTAFVRCWFAGDELRDFVSPAPGDHVKLQVPGADGALTLPVLDEESGRIANRDELALRDMTPREVDAAAGRMRIDFARHGAGAIGEWLERMRPGDECAIVGPRGSKRVVDEVERVVLVADLTAVPSAERRLAELPGAPGGVLHLVVADVADIDHVSFPEHVELVVHELEEDAADGGWPGVAERVAESIPAEGRVLVWAAGEAAGVATIRRVVNEAARDGLVAHFNGYWRAGEAEYDHHAPLPEA